MLQMRVHAQVLDDVQFWPLLLLISIAGIHWAPGQPRPPVPLCPGYQPQAVGQKKKPQSKK